MPIKKYLPDRQGWRRSHLWPLDWRLRNGWLPGRHRALRQLGGRDPGGLVLGVEVQSGHTLGVAAAGAAAADTVQVQLGECGAAGPEVHD